MHLPDPEYIRRAREEIGMTPEEAALLVGETAEDWLSYEASIQSDQYVLISGAAWEMFLVKTEHLRPDNSGFGFRRDAYDRFLTGRSGR